MNSLDILSPALGFDIRLSVDVIMPAMREAQIHGLLCRSQLMLWG